MNVIVIHELDHDDNENMVIGIASSVAKAEQIIEKHYGKDNLIELSYNDIRDSNLEYSKVFEINYSAIPFKVTVTLEWFKINEI